MSSADGGCGLPAAAAVVIVVVVVAAAAGGGVIADTGASIFNRAPFEGVPKGFAAGAPAAPAGANGLVFGANGLAAGRAAVAPPAAVPNGFAFGATPKGFGLCVCVVVV